MTSAILSEATEECEEFWSPPKSSARAALEAKADLTNRVIVAYLSGASTDSPLYWALHSALASSGKRFRALLVLASGEAVQGSESLLLDSAIAVEMVHAHSLILDDLPCMDDAQTRRNKPALHIQYGESIALLAASTLLSEAYAILTRQGDSQSASRCQILSQACGLRGIAQGQVEDLYGIESKTQMKTAPLITGALRLGLNCGSRVTAYQVDRFTQFGLHLGNAYQLRDDAIDEKQNQASLQKQAEQEADRALLVLSHAGLDTPLLRYLVQYAVQRGH